MAVYMCDYIIDMNLSSLVIKDAGCTQVKYGDRQKRICYEAQLTFKCFLERGE